MTQAEIDDLFHTTKKHGAAAAQELKELEALLEQAKTIFAVDAPDGDTDAHLAAEMEEINHIIEDTAKFEDAEEVFAAHEAEAKLAEDASHTIAVDGPDGDPDGHAQEDLLEVKKLIEQAAQVEDKGEIDLRHLADAKVRKSHARDPEHDW